MNSQYPAAMLNDMPVGDPVISNDTNLENSLRILFMHIQNRIIL